MKTRFLQDVSWRTLALELFIVFVGLLAALQVDEWREQRSYREAESRYLLRLKNDLDASIRDSKAILQLMEGHYNGVRHVHESLVAGEILNDDTELFGFGLVYVGHMPAVPIHRSAYDEMVASGMFARLRSERLKTIVSDLYATQDVVDRNFSWWRDGVLRLGERLAARVEYYDVEGARQSSPSMLNEPNRRVRFDFDDLQSDRLLRNGFYWATDTHSDWVEWTRVLVGLAEEASAEVAAELARRGE